MDYLILALLFLLSGFFMKFSDDLFDVNGDIKFASLLGILCGIASGFAAVYDIGAAYIFISIPIGNLLALKVDGIHHIIALAVFVLICIIFGIPELNIIVLLICILAILSDEVGHEMISKVTDNLFFNLFFEYRFVMKIVVLLLAISGVFNFWIFPCFLSFEIAYVIAGIVFENLN